MMALCHFYHQEIGAARMFYQPKFGVPPNLNLDQEAALLLPQKKWWSTGICVATSQIGSSPQLTAENLKIGRPPPSLTFWGDI